MLKDNKDLQFNYGDQERNCGTCDHSDCGVCDMAGEVSSVYVCNKWEKRDK